MSFGVEDVARMDLFQAASYRSRTKLGINT